MIQDFFFLSFKSCYPVHKWQVTAGFCSHEGDALNTTYSLLVWLDNHPEEWNMQLKIKLINTQGQISIGKKYAGNKVQVEEYPDGSVLLTPVEVITKFELKLLKDKLFHNRLTEFDQWEADNRPKETDPDYLESSSED